MNRIDRNRIEGAELPHSCLIEPRFSDLDLNGHVNNVAIADILQEGRFRFCNAAGLGDNRDAAVIAVAIVIEFAASLMPGQPITVLTGVSRIGRTSFELVQVLRQGGRNCVYSEAAHVTAGPSGAVPIPDCARASLEAMLLPV